MFLLVVKFTFHEVLYMKHCSFSREDAGLCSLDKAQSSM